MSGASLFLLNLPVELRVEIRSYYDYNENYPYLYDLKDEIEHYKKFLKRNSEYNNMAIFRKYFKTVIKGRFFSEELWDYLYEIIYMWPNSLNYDNLPIMRTKLERCIFYKSYIMKVCMFNDYRLFSWEEWVNDNYDSDESD